MIDVIRCLLLSMYDKTLILPYSAVAEVIPFENAKTFANTTGWILGTIEWRQLNIPLISLEDIDRTASSFLEPSRLHIAILNRILEGKGPDFIGLVLQSIPKISRFKRSDIQYLGTSDRAQLSMAVSVRGQPAFIPNLQWIEENIPSPS
jgi:chemosensory pili system protein ChpC